MSNVYMQPDEAVRREFIRVLAQIKRRQIANAYAIATDSRADKHAPQSIVSSTKRDPVVISEVANF